MSDRPSLLERFWDEAARSPLVVLTDFDYTVSQVDVGDLITTRLAPPSPDTLRRYLAQEIGTRQYWLDSIVRADVAEARQIAAGIGIDPHFPAFVAWCRQEQIPLAVVSDGFSFYIRAILDREGLHDLPVFCNEMPETGTLLFPNGNPVCDRCGCCKAGIVRRVKGLGARVVYFGDGLSDLYAIGFADYVFARGSLARHMAAQGSPYFPLRNFGEACMVLRERLEEITLGTFAGRSTVGPSPLCRFSNEEART
jgi:2-hydroxy-3-keto-5-methylthiopentenyl-1-phosphate phosphatase